MQRSGKRCDPIQQKCSAERGAAVGEARGAHGLCQHPEGHTPSSTFSSFTAWDTVSFVDVQFTAHNKNPDNNNNNNNNKHHTLQIVFATRVALHRRLWVLSSPPANITLPNTVHRSTTCRKKKSFLG